MKKITIIMIYILGKTNTVKPLLTDSPKIRTNFYASTEIM